MKIIAGLLIAFGVLLLGLQVANAFQGTPTSAVHAVVGVLLLLGGLVIVAIGRLETRR
jgi:hypothetical protein